MSYFFEQRREINLQPVRERLNRIKAGIRPTGLDSGHIRPSETAPVSELLLIHACGKTEFTYPMTEAMT